MTLATTSVSHKSRLASADDGFYFSFMKPINGVTESCEGAYSDNYSVKHTEKYIPSILNENSEENFSSPFSISYKFNYGWISNPSYSVESNCGLLQISGAEYLPDSYELGFLHSYVDFATPAFSEETGEEIGLMTYSFQSMPMYLSSDGSLCRTYEQHINGFKNTMNPNSTLPAMQHPAFSYDESQALILQGAHNHLYCLILIIIMTGWMRNGNGILMPCQWDDLVNSVFQILYQWGNLMKKPMGCSLILSLHQT